MKLFRNHWAVGVLLTLIASCEQDELSEIQFTDGLRIKSVASNDQVVSRYKYDQQGNIAEWESTFFYNRYLYDDEGRLIRSESAVDPLSLSAVFVEKTTLMTSENAAIDRYQTFDYGPDGKLAEIKTYLEKEGDFVYTSMGSFEYDGEAIVRTNLHNETGKITQFRTYEYDSRGNVKHEKYYSLVSTQEPELMNESTFRYDEKRNPFSVFKALGNPGLFSNVNNIMEAKTTYAYNQDDYPVKVVSGNSEFAYRY